MHIYTQYMYIQISLALIESFLGRNGSFASAAAAASALESALEKKRKRRVKGLGCP